MQQDDTDNLVELEPLHFSRENLRVVIERARCARQRSKELIARSHILRDRSRKKK